MPYLVDGHNLIGFMPDLDFDDPDDEAKLVIKLRGFVASHTKARKKHKVVVIFDRGLPGGKSALSNGAVEVIFASELRSNADEVIKQRIRKTRDAKNWTVVTSDNEVLQVATSHKMRGMRCAEFARLMKEIKQKQATSVATSSNPIVSESDVDEWLAIFGDDDST